MATKISFFRRPGDTSNGYRDETIYFKDSKARKILDTKQIKLKAGRGLKLEDNILSIVPTATGSVNLNQFSFTAKIDGKKISYTTFGNPKIFKEAANGAKAEFLNYAFPQQETYYMNTFFESDFTPDSSSTVETTPNVPTNAYTIGLKINDIPDDDNFDFFAIFITDISELRESEDSVIGYISVFDNDIGRVSYIENYSYDEYGQKNDTPGRAFYVEHEVLFKPFLRNL